MIFNNPWWFWLGLAVFIPVIIHLWKRKSGKPRLLGTFRFLPEKDFAASRSIELHEIPLLLIRIGMVILLVLLLTQLFWNVEKPKIESLTVTEADIENSIWQEDEEANVVLVTPGREIQQKGWWNILAQLEYVYEPERLVAKGDFSEQKFNNKRPVMASLPEWETVDSLSPEEKLLAIWNSGSNEYRGLFQRKGQNGVSVNIESVGDVEALVNEVPRLDSVIMIVNEQNTNLVNSGLIHAANTWGITTEEQSITEVIRLISGNQSWSLQHFSTPNGGKVHVGPNPITGIGFQITNMDTSAQYDQELLASEGLNTPFLSINNKGELVINGKVDPDLESWVFAAAGNQLILNAFGVEGFLTPEINLEQRNPVVGSAFKKAPQKQASAKLWLLGLLILCWMAERWLAPRRGM